MKPFMVVWAVLLIFGAMGLAARSFNPAANAAITAPPAPPSRTAFLHEKPWPDRKQLGPETYEVLIGLINATRYYCPQVWHPGGGAFAIGAGTFGNDIAVHCTTGAFRISIRPDTDQYVVRPLL